MPDYAHLSLVGKANIIVFLLLIVLCFAYVIVLHKTHNIMVLRGMKNVANTLLGVASLMFLMPFAEQLYGAIQVIHSIATATTGDPRVIMGGIAQFLAPILVGLVCYTIIYIFWGVLRLLHAISVDKIELS